MFVVKHFKAVMGLWKNITVPYSISPSIIDGKKTIFVFR